MARVAHRALMGAAGAAGAALLVALGCGSDGPDVLPPQLDAAIELRDGYAAFVPGDSLGVTVTGSDDQQLEWFGFFLEGSAGDSVRVSGRETSRTLRVAIPQSSVGVHRLVAFARDAAGNRRLSGGDTIEIIDAVRRSLISLAIPGPVHDWVIDSSRNRLYLSIPLAQQVAILDLTTRQWLPPLHLFGNPLGLDLTPNGDSLFVALRRTHYLGIVNLQTRTLDTIRLALANEFETGPERIRLMSNRKLIITTAFDGSGYSSVGILEYDLGTATQQRRVAFASAIHALARSGDRSRLVLVLQNGCCPAQGYYYSAVADTFIFWLTVDRFFPAVSVDAHGNRFLIDNVVFDSTRSVVQALGYTALPDSLRNWATIISPSGAFAYIARDRAYQKMRIADATDVGRVLIPLTPYLFMIHPDGGLLVAATYDAVTGENRVWLVSSP